MAEPTTPTPTTSGEPTEKKSTVIDFGSYYQSIAARGEAFNPAIIAQAFSQVKKEDPTAKLDFSADAYKGLKESLGEEEANKVQKAYLETLELNEISDRQDFFAPVALNHFQNDLEGIKNFSALAKNELKIDPVFRNNSIYKPYQYRTFQEAAESNLNYFDENGKLQKLKDSEDYGDIAGGFGIGFGGSSLTVATNGFVAETNPELKKAIEEGFIDENAYYRDENGQYAYRKLRQGEQNVDHVRSIFGPRTLYGQGLLRDSAEGFYDGLLGLIEGAGTLGYYGQKTIGLPLRLIGFKGYDNHLNEQFNDFVNMTARMKSNGSDEEDRGVTHSLSNFSKAVFNGVGQIVGTMGTGYAIGGAMKGVNAISQASKIGKLSGVYAADFAAGTTRALNFGIAAKAGKEESLRHGLSKDESDIMGLIAGGIMMGTEYLTGSQFIPKMAGKAGYAETTKKVTQYFINEAEKQGIKVGQVLATKPQILKESMYKAHQWLESSASNRAMSFVKGYTGEAIQETSEDFSFSLVKEGYDMLSGNHSFDQNWGDVGESLMGSFLVGGFSGGLTKFATFSKRREQEDLIDEKRNSLIVNEVAAGNAENLKLAVEDAFIKGQLGSKVLSASKDENGKKVLVANSPGTKSENEFFRDVFLQQIEFAEKVHQRVKSKGATKQEIADIMFELMGQKAFEGEVSLDDLTKGISTAIEVEAMQLFRMESLRLGKIALSIAKTKAPTSESKVHKIDSIRVVNDRVVAVKRIGDAEFSEPSIEERAAIEMAYRDVTTNTTTGFKSKFDQFRNDLSKAVVLKKNLETTVSRLNEQAKVSPFGQKKIAELDEAIAEEDKISKEFKQFMQDQGLEPELIEDAVQLVFMDQFKEKLTNGDRALRYVKNYRINEIKKNYKEVFKSRPEYNIEDFESEKGGFDYFSESSSEMIKNSNLLTEELSTNLSNAIALGDANQIIQLVTLASENNVSIKDQSLQETKAFIESFMASFTESYKDEYLSKMLTVASIVKFVTEGKVNENAIMAEGLPGILTSDVTEELSEELLSNISQPDLILMANELTPYIGTEFTQEAYDELINETIPSFISAKTKFDLRKNLNEAERRADAMKKGLLSGINSIDGFSQNQNIRLKYNYGPNDSIQSVIKNKMEEAVKAPKEFVDNGTLPDLINEIRKNQRYILSRIVEIVNKDKDVELVQDDELQVLQENFEYLEKQLGDIENLMLISDRNRGDRFKRDYEVKIDYITTAIDNLTKIDKILGLGLHSEIAALSAGPILKSENQEEVDAAFETIVKLEEEVSASVQALSKEDAESLMNQLVFDHVPVKDVGHYLFKSFNEDQKKPFNPESSLRDKLELSLNYVSMLSRGKVRDFFTLSDKYIKARNLKEQFIPSQEQLLITRFIYSKLSSDHVSTVEQAVIKAVSTEKTTYDPNLIYAKGIAGAGKSTMVVNLGIELLALRNKEVYGRDTVVGYSAPIQTQIDNVAKSLNSVMSDSVTSEEIEISHKPDVADFSDKDFLVIDEVTVFGPKLELYLSWVREHNSKNSKQIKVLFAGDELQMSGEVTPEPFIYANATRFFMERAIPLTTPYRSGKVDSFDLNGNHREIIAELAKLYMTAKREGQYTFPEGGTVSVNMRSNGPELAMLPEYANEIIASMIKPKTTTYYQENGVVEYGVRAYTTSKEVLEKFANDYSKKADPSGMVLITDKTDFAESELKSFFRDLGVNITDSKISELVRTPASTQGLTFDHVYSAIELKEESTLSDSLKNLQSLYVANSREKLSLVMVSPFGTVDSREVLSKSSIPSFAELNLKQKVGDDLIEDSLELFNNNKHIAEVIEKLAGEPLKPETVKVEVPAPVLSKIAVGPDGLIAVEEELEQSNEEAIDPSLTVPKPLEQMSEEEKKLADEAIKENEEREKKILDEINNTSLDDLMATDPEDMFKGCSI